MPPSVSFPIWKIASSVLENFSSVNWRALIDTPRTGIGEGGELGVEVGEETTPLEFGTPQYGHPQGARDPRFIQFGLKLYF